MPTLDWIGKRAVVNHHRELPYRLLHCDDSLSAGEPGAGNLLVEGDNLHALKALLPYYAGRVKCIYIDPPYNTGNEGWVYNDNVNAPEIQKWLGDTVGKEADDLSRHDKWLCMMYPRLALLREFLTDDGSIWVCLDDNEIGNLRFVLDELFGRLNFIADIAWEKRYTRSNNAKLFYSLKDHILVYRKRAAVETMKEPRNLKSDENYDNPDNDPRGAWMTASYVNPATKAQRPKLFYPLTNPFTNQLVEHPTHAWKYEQDTYKQHVADNRLWWGKSGEAKFPRLKLFLREQKKGLVPVDIWKYEDSGTTDDGGNEVKSIFGYAAFDTPKPDRLVERILKIATSPGDLVLDSFAGSGTTGHAVLRMNANAPQEEARRFILVEIDRTIARDITAERLRRVSNGWDNTSGLGGGFRFCTLGEPCLDAEARFSPGIEWRDLGHHLWFAETGEPWHAGRTSGQGAQSLSTGGPMLGVTTEGRAIYLLHTRLLQGQTENGANALTAETLAQLAPHDGPRVVYGESCTLRASALSRERIVFKQIPYQVRQQ